MITVFQRVSPLHPHFWPGLSALCGLLLLTGCGAGGPKDQGPVTFHAQGKVVVSGKSPDGAVITLHPVDKSLDIRPNAVVKEDGQFVLTSVKPGDGAPAGDYNVTVVWPEEELPAASGNQVGKITSMGGEGESKKAPRDRLEGRYANPESSGLKCTIKNQAQNEIPVFDLK